MKQPFYAWDDAEPKDAMTERDEFDRWYDKDGSSEYSREVCWAAWQAARLRQRPAFDAEEAKDAARYRFAKTMEGQVLTIDVFRNRGADELDAAIDAAMKGSK